jgi:hypothetical protein
LPSSMVTFLIGDTFTDSLARLTGDEQKAAKTTAFDLQMDPSAPGLSFHRLDKAKGKRFWSVRVNAADAAAAAEDAHARSAGARDSATDAAKRPADAADAVRCATIRRRCSSSVDVSTRGNGAATSCTWSGRSSLDR